MHQNFGHYFFGQSLLLSTTVLNDIYSMIYVLYVGINGQDVTIVTDPAGTLVAGQPNTFDYPILTNVTLNCILSGFDGSASFYYWTETNCYTHPGGVDDPCFYSANISGQSVTGYDLLAQDAGTVTCTANIGDVEYTSDPLTLHISGKQLHIYSLL